MQPLFTTIAMVLCAQMASVAFARSGGSSLYCGTRRWQTLIEDAAGQAMVPPSWVEAVLRAESAGCDYMNGSPTTSSAGAMGLMQLMPGTWVRLRIQLHLGLDPFDHADNILAGAWYLRELYDQFGLEGAIAAYHSGPARYEQHLRTGKALPDGTLNYLSRVLANIHPEATEEPIFVQQISTMKAGIRTRDAFTSALMSGRSRPAELAPSQSLFISLKHADRMPTSTLPDAKDIPTESGRKSDHGDELRPDPEAR